MLTVFPKQTASMYTRDDVRLDADVYRPDADGEFPVLLMRQPYGRTIASTVVYAHPNWYAAHGYIVVIQDVRGRGTSDGEFKLFTHEIEDGFDTVNWAANLPGSTGDVGMYGFSYQGMTQLYAAASKPTALKTICPAMIGYDLYADWAYEGGAFCLQTNLAWAIQLAAETARLRKDVKAYQALLAASLNLPLYDATPNHPEVLKEFAPESFYHEWLAHPQPDDYWQKLSPKTYLKDVDLPMFHIGGWFDTYLRGTLHLYDDMASRNTTPQHLLVGPWAHLPWSRQVGQTDFGDQAVSPVDQMQVRWFEEFLKGVDTGLLREAPICWFKMGSNLWQNFPIINKLNQKSYFLSSTGLAHLREDSGTLVESPISNVFDTVVNDPWRPAPSIGGHAGIPSGCMERSHIDARADILTYTSAALTEELHLAGDVVVEIFCQCDRPSYDLCAVLSEIHPDKKVYNFAQGYLRCHSTENDEVKKIQLQATCIRIAKGNKLRLSFSGACFPAYAMNPGNNSELRMDASMITLTVKSGNDYPSRVLLPVI